LISRFSGSQMTREHQNQQRLKKNSQSQLLNKCSRMLQKKIRPLEPNLLNTKRLKAILLVLLGLFISRRILMTRITSLLKCTRVKLKMVWSMAIAEISKSRRVSKDTHPFAILATGNRTKSLSS